MIKQNLDEKLANLSTKNGRRAYGIVWMQGWPLIVERDPEAELGISP